MSVLFYYFVILVNFLPLGFSKEQVPVLLWSPSLSLPTVSGLKEISTLQFNQLVQHIASTKEPIIAVFLEDELSVEDFNLRFDDGEAVFPALSNAIKETDSAFLSSVINPMKALRLLRENGYDWKHYREDLSTLFSKPTVVVVSLESKNNGDQLDVLRHHDKIISRIYNKLSEEHPNLLAVYTGKHSQWAEESKKYLRVRRADDPPEGDDDVYTGVVINSSPTVIVAESIVYERGENDRVELKTPTEVVNKNGTEVFEYLVEVTFAEGETLTFNLSDMDYAWELKSINSKDGKIFTTRQYIGAPSAWSWFCAQDLLFTETKEYPYLNITGLQVQAQVEGYEFGQALDCTPYFSIAIWMGIFVIGLLIFIMSWGIVMIMDINTNDRFDDPKGKTITISATD